MTTAGTHTHASHAGEKSVRDDLDTLRADLNAIKTDLRTLAEDSATMGKHAARQARERLGEVAGQVGDKARAAYDAAKTKGVEASDALEEKIEEHPFLSVGIAFGAGLVIGALISRR